MLNIIFLKSKRVCTMACSILVGDREVIRRGQNKTNLSGNEEIKLMIVF
jgi:hypothetical protein